MFGDKYYENEKSEDEEDIKAERAIDLELMKDGDAKEDDRKKTSK